MYFTVSRRTLFATPIALAALGAIPAQAVAAPPTVNMEKLVLAAQLDPVKPDNGLTPGARDSVLAVEQALADRGHLKPNLVDGHYGTATITAYKKWQESLGYRDLAANGLPGTASLRKLGEGRFTITRIIGPGAKTTHQGYAINRRTLAMLREAERISRINFTVEQGSYSVGVDPTSAGTHDGGGTLDLDAEALDTAQKNRAVTAMRRVGFAAWLRTPSQGDWPEHFHIVAISDTDLAAPAQKQIGRYYLGRNGLANNGPDDGPAVAKVTWEDYQRSRARPTAGS